MPRRCRHIFWNRPETHGGEIWLLLVNRDEDTILVEPPNYTWLNFFIIGKWQGVFVSKRQASVMNEEGWRSRSRGYLDRALVFFSEVYDRAFGDYSDAASDIMHNMAGLTTDRQSLVTLVFKASAVDDHRGIKTCRCLSGRFVFVRLWSGRRLTNLRRLDRIFLL